MKAEKLMNLLSLDQVKNTTHTNLPFERTADSTSQPSPRRRARASSEHNNAVCPITYESIRDFPKQDIYTTLTGVQYHTPSLKRWLQTHNIVPHTGLDASEEIHRLWPHVRRVERQVDRLRFPIYCQIGLVAGLVLTEKHLPKATVRWLAWTAIAINLCTFLAMYKLRDAAKLAMTDEEIEKAELGIDYYRS